MRLPARMMPHKNLVSYRPYLGEGADGAVYGDEVLCARAAIDDKRRFVRTADGREFMASGRVALDYPDHDVPPGSQVTVWRGRSNERTSTVVLVALADWPQLPKFLELTVE